MIILRSLRPQVTKLAKRPQRCCRALLSSLPNNPQIYHFQQNNNPKSQVLSYLPTEPPNESLSIGITTAIPPTPHSFTPNPNFLKILNSVLKAHAIADPRVQSQAAAYASSAGSNLGLAQPGTSSLPPNHPAARSQREARKRSRAPGPGVSTSGAGPTGSQGGPGGGGRGGWVHVSDERNPPDFGRIAWPEDIFGSLEVDSVGGFVGENGNWQESGTYRIVTNEGILGLSPYLRERLVERLEELEKDGSS